MSTRKSTYFYGVLIALTSLVGGMIIASRLDLTPSSLAGPLNVPASNSAPISGPLTATTFRDIARAVNPAVVSIHIQTTRQARSFGDLFGFGNPFGGGNGQGDSQPVPVEGAGSGFIIDPAGYILTNNHVIEDAKSITVFLSNMDETLGDYTQDGLPAKVIGHDELTDTALLQLTSLPKEPLTPVKFGDSSQMEAGDWVMAIGNPFEYQNTVTVGVVSAVGRPFQTATQGRWQDMIQTDAAINRGNSGGPLLNIRGEVIGINTLIVTNNQTQGNIGIGFSIPINTVTAILPQLHTGKVIRGHLGATLYRAPITTADAQGYGLSTVMGAIVTGVTDGPAKKAGIKPDDVIVEYNGKAVKDSGDLVNMVVNTKPGTTVPVRIIRDKKPLTVHVTIDELDLQAEQQQAEGETAQPEQQRRPDTSAPEQTSLGMRIGAITPGIARQLGLPDNQTGAVVMSVDPLGPADRASVQRGDVIVSVDGQDVTTVGQAAAAIAKVPSGRMARLIVLRGDQEQLVLVRKP
jgi:serine protease Do